ncbi:MAG: hypothetical protein JKX70_04875 [Phycisphaerales bacterium]|nr:hypothetical protein [Phycisphaerales bacterium]
MAFTGKASYGAGAGLPELVEDVSDIIGIVSPFETPLLDHLGDAKRAAMSTVHEWIEDALLPNKGQLNQSTFNLIRRRHRRWLLMMRACSGWAI